MNKGLESFVKLQSLLKELITTITLDQALILGENIDIIETELKRLEEENKALYKHIDRQDKELLKLDEILRIIKECEVNIFVLIRAKTVLEYNNVMNRITGHLKNQLNQYEFDLLRGYFK